MQVIFLHDLVLALTMINSLRVKTLERIKKMKKFKYLLTVLLPAALLVNISAANAQRKNHTRNDVPVQTEAQVGCTGGAECKCADGAPYPMMQKKADRMQNKEKKGMPFEKDLKEVNENYDEAIKKIDRSNFSAEQKVMLKNQAKENKDLMLKQYQERQELLKKHWEANKSLKQNMTKDKADRKAVKKVRKILTDD